MCGGAVPFQDTTLNTVELAGVMKCDRVNLLGCVKVERMKRIAIDEAAEKRPSGAVE